MCIISKISFKCEESYKNTEIVDFLILIISCFFPKRRIGTYRQVLHLFVGSYKHGDILYYYYRLGVLAYKKVY